MRGLILIFIGALFFALSCSDTEEQPVDKCGSDFAAFYLDSDYFKASYSADGGEFMLPNGENCGLAASYTESGANLLVHVLGEAGHLHFHVEVGMINQALDLRNAYFVKDGLGDRFETLSAGNQSYVMVESLDEVNNIVTGTFAISLSNDNGQIVQITEGSFSCSYHEI